VTTETGEDFFSAMNAVIAANRSVKRNQEGTKHAAKETTADYTDQPPLKDEMTKHKYASPARTESRTQDIFFAIRFGSFLRHYTFVIRHLNNIDLGLCAIN
jgi:hypothetical protein